MLFNSIDFAVFLPIVFFIYWLLNGTGLKAQNIFLVIVSYIFYGWWDYRFLSLIVLSTLVDFLIGKQLVQVSNDKGRKYLLLLSIIINIGLLGFFKYYNFFVDNFVDLFSLFGTPFNPRTLNIILPVGISFYTFQTLSYTIDIYRKRIPATNDIFVFAAYVSFFPQLVAGPIERAQNLLPQFSKKRIFDDPASRDGLRQMLWGFFKKVVVADNCAIYVDQIFDGYQTYDPLALIIGAILFSFQIYCDFSGYSDIAIGLAKLFGLKLSLNFAYPYFSRDIGEFWRRWHISLSTWFRDYLYIPLGGSKVAKSKAVRNIFIIFLVSGLWHGANWTFLIWGALNAIYFVPIFLFNKNRKNLAPIEAPRFFPSLSEFIQIILTFTLVTLGWIFFRSANVNMALAYLERIITGDFLILPDFFSDKQFLIPVFFIAILLTVEWLQRTVNHGLDFSRLSFSRFFRWSIYFTLCLIIFLFAIKEQDFIYFQF